MSIERCHECQRTIDTDVDAECYVDIGNMRRLEKIVPLCQMCREDDNDMREMSEQLGLE